MDLGVDGFSRLVDLLEKAREGFPEVLPASLDVEFCEIAEGYRAAPSPLRDQIRDQIPFEYWLPLLSLGDRQLEWALLDRDGLHLTHALIAHCIEDLRFDSRENLIRLAAIWHGAELLELDARRFFLEAGDLGSRKAEEELRDFANRPADERTLRSVGLETYEEGGRVRFRLRPPPWLKPANK